MTNKSGSTPMRFYQRSRHESHRDMLLLLQSEENHPPKGIDVVLRVDDHALSSAAVIGIVVGCVLLLLLIIDILCCLIGNLGLLAMMCRRRKRSPSELGDEEKLGSGSLIKERPPSPLPLPPPFVKLGATTPLEDEKQPLNTLPEVGVKTNMSVEFDGRGVQTRSGEIIGKNSSV